MNLFCQWRSLWVVVSITSSFSAFASLSIDDSIFDSTSITENKDEQVEEWQVDQSIILDLKENVLLAQNRVRLSDILQCVGVLSVCQKIINLDIAASPKRRAEVRRFSKKEIQALLAQMDFIDQRYKFVGAEQVSVKADLVDVNLDDLVSELQTTIQQKLVEFDLSEKLRLVSIKSTLRSHMSILKGNIQKHWDISDYKNSPKDFLEHILSKKPFVVTIKSFNENNELIDEMQKKIRVRSEWEHFVVVAAERLVRGQILDEQALEYSWLPLLRRYDVYEKAFYDTKPIIGMDLSRSLSRGKKLDKQSIYVPYLVSRGDLVEVQVVSSTLQVKAKAKVLSKGRKNDTVPVMLLGSRKKLEGVLINENQVKVNL